MVPVGSLLANVDGAMNAVEVNGDAVGQTLYYGAGAGELPTASAVVADLMEIAREIQRGGVGPVSPLSYTAEHLGPKPMVTPEGVIRRSYLRFAALDEPGTLARIAGALGQFDVGIESVIQRHSDREAGPVPVIILTHPAPESALRMAIQEADGLNCVSSPTIQIPIEEDL